MDTNLIVTYLLNPLCVCVCMCVHSGLHQKLHWGCCFEDCICQCQELGSLRSKCTCWAGCGSEPGCLNMRIFKCVYCHLWAPILLSQRSSCLGLFLVTLLWVLWVHLSVIYAASCIYLHTWSITVTCLHVASGNPSSAFLQFGLR